MKVILTTANASYIHKNLALRWLYVSKPDEVDAKILEFTIKEDREKVIEQLLNENPDVIAFSVYIWNSPIIKDWIKEIKQKVPSITLICGGPEATFLDSQWIDAGADYVVLGEGEQVFWPLICEGEISSSVTSKITSGTKIAQTDLFYLEQLPSPYFLDMDMPSFHLQYLYIESTRGCPFHCTYCLSSLEEGIRLFSDTYMTTLIMQLEKYKPKQIKFLDRTFNLFPTRALQIAKQLNELRWDASIQFECEVTSMAQKLVDYFAYQAKKERFRFEVGVQSFQPKTLEAVRRVQNNEQVKRILTLWSQSGLIVHADLIAGLPYETLELFLDSYHQLLSTQPAEIQVGILKILPKTQMDLTSRRWGIEALQQAPYTIKKTHWLSYDDVEDVSALAFATDKLYNIPRCKTLIGQAFQLGVSVGPILIAIGHLMKKHDQLQVKDMIQITYEHFKGVLDENIVRGALLFDLGEMSKVRPSKWIEDSISPAITEIIREQIVSRSELTYDFITRKAWIASAYVFQRHGYQARFFMPDKKISYLFNEEGECIHEQTTRYRNK